MIQRLTILLASLALIAGGCGASDESALQQPLLPPVLADELAARSDRIAETLARGDECGADAQADELRRAATAAVDSGRVPRPLRRELLDAVTALADQIACTPPAPAAAEEEEEEEEEEDKVEKEDKEDEAKDKGKGEKNGKGKGKGKD
jgi:hypothetical protein